MEEMIDFLKFFIPILIILGLIGLGAGYSINKIECSSYSEVTGRETKIDNFVCYIKHNGQWYSKSEFRYSMESIK